MSINSNNILIISFFFLFSIQTGLASMLDGGKDEVEDVLAIHNAGQGSTERSLLLAAEEGRQDSDSSLEYYGSRPDVRVVRMNKISDNQENPAAPVVAVIVKGNTDNDMDFYKHSSGLRRKNPHYEINPDTPFQWDNTYENVKETDDLFFSYMNRPTSKKAVIATIIGAIVGLGPAQANIPMINASLGDTFHLTIDGSAIWIIGGTVTVLATPIYMKQLGTLGGDIVRYFEEDPFAKRRFNHSNLHKISNFLVFLTTLVRISPRVAYYISLEHGFLSYSIPTAIPLAIAELARSYQVGSKIVDQAFYSTYTGSTNPLLKREIVKRAIAMCRKKIITDSRYANHLYTLLATKDMHNDYIHTGSLLLVNTAIRDPTVNFELDVDEIAIPTQTKGFLSRLSDTVIMGGSMFANYAGVKYTLQSLVFQSTSTAADVTSKVISVINMGAQLFLEANVTRDFITTAGGLFSWSTSYNPLRKPTQFLDLVNAGAHIFPSIYLAKKGLANTDGLEQVLLLTPYAIRELAYYVSYFTEQSESLITQAAMLRMQTPTLNQKRNYLTHFMDAWETEIDRMETEPFQNYFQLIYNKFDQS